MIPNPPARHHYIPCFYTKRWSLSGDRKICEFSKPYDRVIERRKFPENTGHSEDLYKLFRALPHEPQEIETTYFKPLDTGACAALDYMAAGEDPQSLSQEKREAWAKFVMSLLVRCPEDIDFLRRKWLPYISRISPEQEEKWARERQEGDARTLADILDKASDGYIENSMFYALQFLLDAERSREKMVAATWVVVDTSRSVYELLTSDRPIFKSDSLGVGGNLTMPVGPRELLVIMHAATSLPKLSQAKLDKVVNEANSRVVEAARRFVYASDSRPLHFVARRFGTKPTPRIVEQGMLRRYHDL